MVAGAGSDVLEGAVGNVYLIFEMLVCLISLSRTCEKREAMVGRRRLNIYRYYLSMTQITRL